jgi:hypothetical protein
MYRYVISYDLTSQDHLYDALISRLYQLGVCKLHRTLWVLRRADFEIQSLRRDLLRFLLPWDRLFIARLSTN